MAVGPCVPLDPLWSRGQSTRPGLALVFRSPSRALQTLPKSRGSHRCPCPTFRGTAPSGYFGLSTCLLSPATAVLCQEVGMEGLQVGGTSPALGAAGLPLASCPLTSGPAPENRMVTRPGVAGCPLLGHQGLQPESRSWQDTAAKGTEQSSAAWTALGTAQTQCWPGHQDYISPLAKSTMGVLASTWKAIRDSQEEISHQEGLLLLSICSWKALP